MVTNIVAVKLVNNKISYLFWVFAVSLLSVGIMQYYYFSAELSSLLRSVFLLFGVIAASVVWGFTAQGQNFLILWRQALQELRQVVWPNRKETLQTTALVILMVSIMAVTLWVIDTILLWLVAKIT